MVSIKFKIERLKRLYKDYYRLYILTDELRYTDFVDIETDEFIDLFLKMSEIVESDSLNAEIIE